MHGADRLIALQPDAPDVGLASAHRKAALRHASGSAARKEDAGGVCSPTKAPSASITTHPPEPANLHGDSASPTGW